MQPLLTDAALQTPWAATLTELGAVESFGDPIVDSSGDGWIVRVPVMLERGGLALVLVLSADGFLTGLQLAPDAPPVEWEPPDYADVDTFVEHDVTLGSGSLAVGGTLSLPRSTGPHPAVVLLSGSGPQDRDETIGPNKVLKDLAWGLASVGIAALRFDKVTLTHGRELAGREEFTMVDEYLPQALAAVGLLRERADIASDRIFVAGHSLGGTVAPRVGAAAPALAGLVLLAGGAQRMHHAALRQFHYLQSLDLPSVGVTQELIDDLAARVAKVDDPALSTATPASELPFNVPAAYWLDVRDYDQVAAAAALTMPMLVLNGGRDYQVTLDDDLALWRAALAGHNNVAFTVYDDANHVFIAGTGPCTPAEYAQPGHMEARVVADIAAWVRGV